MKYITACALIAIFTKCALAEPATKATLMRDIVQAYGMDQMITEAKTAAETQASTAVEQMFAQIKSSIPALSPEVLHKIEAAADKMISAVQRSWSTEEALQIWQQEYSADLTVEELAKIVEACKTPLGQKQITASKRASGAFQKYLLDRNKSVVERAMREYVTDLQKIIAEQAK